MLRKLLTFVLGALAATTPLSASLVIVPTFDSSILNDPNSATIQSTINSAISVYEQLFLDPISVSIYFQESNTGLGGSSTWFNTVSYSSFLSHLTSDATTASDLAALAGLTGGTHNPVDGPPSAPPPPICAPSASPPTPAVLTTASCLSIPRS